jgi:protein O-GlcNAc transferase
MHHLPDCPNDCRVCCAQMGSVFGLVDRSRIEVFLYALSAADGSPYRARIETETEHFINASALSVPELATRIHADGIQILVDLNGYTKGAKTEVFALRPAPVQIAYMGFPATTGASFMDWLVTDRVVAPPSLAHCYSERLCRLPHCYFVNDYARSCPEALDEARRPSRAAVGLPPHAFIFSCSNQLYKVDPRIFDTWCAILRRVPGSVLWLLRFPPFGEARLRAEAARRGVAPERLVFTDVAPKEQHILRSGLADLFLDTPLVNAHTTGTDVLWSGVPMLTLPGERFASRVGASLMSALGCGDCILASRAEYEERAVELATHPDALRRLTARVRRNRRAMPCVCCCGNTGPAPRWHRCAALRVLMHARLQVDAPVVQHTQVGA